MFLSFSVSVLGVIVMSDASVLLPASSAISSIIPASLSSSSPAGLSISGSRTGWLTCSISSGAICIGMACMDRTTLS